MRKMENFRLVKLTQETLKVQCKIDDYEHWGAPLLDVKQWKQKDAAQRETPFSQEGALFWALVDKTQENSNSRSDCNLVAGQDLLYCHCKTIRFPCVYHHSSGEIEHGYSYQISSVYTLPEFRRRGLAGFFLTEVSKQVKQLPLALISVLYSDVGPTFYDKLGWKCHPSNMATLQVDHPLNTTSNVDSFNLEPFLVDEKLETFLEADNDRLVEELSSSSSFQGQETFLILPTRGSIEWQFCNGLHYALAGGLDELPSRCGVKINDESFVIWWHNFKEDTLYISRARFPDSGDNAVVITCNLLDAAMQEARKFKLTKVVIWDPPSGLVHEDVQRHLSIEFSERQLSLSSAKVFRRGVYDSEKNLSATLPTWFKNEKYAWV